MKGLPILHEAAAFLNPELCWLLTMSLLHSLWQGAILAIIVACLVRSKNSLTVHQRFVGVFVLLMLIAASPVANFFWLSNSVNPSRSSELAAQQYFPDGQLSLFPVGELTGQNTLANEISIFNASISSATATRSIEQGRLTSTRLQPIRDQATGRLINWSVAGSTLATLLYFLGVFIMVLRLAFGLKSQWRISRACSRLAVIGSVPESVALAADKAALSLGRSLRIPIALFQGHGVAMVVGCFRPMVLLNTTLVSGLTPVQLEQILAHELAHIYRYDPLTQLAQRLVESALFFHPAVWFVSRQITDLREMCCDDLVAGNYCPIGYADTLLRCVAIAQGEPTANPDTPEIKAGSQFSLAAIGTRTSQLTTRIEVLLGIKPDGRTTKPLGQSKWLRILIVGTTVLSLSALFCYLAIATFSPDAMPSVALAAHQQVPTESPQTIPIPAWKWQTIETSKIEPGAFLFGGKELMLSESIPADVKIEAMVVEEFCRFAQWHFGDSSSTRVAIVIEMDGPSINRVFIDSNRDRIVEDSEQVTLQTNEGKTWLTMLDVEILENDQPIHAARQIGITPKRKQNAIRITTLGYAEGEINVAGSLTAVRRIDLDGNGLPNDSRDQIWFDFDRDGEFNLLEERQSLKNFVDLAGRRYAVRSDRLGQSLKLTADDEQGSVRFVFDLADKDATLEILEGSLQDESGLLIAIRPSEEPVTVPAGRYCVENLVVQVRDAEGTTWRMTLFRGLDQGWFNVAANEQHDLKLLDSIQIHAKPVHLEDEWSGHLTHLEPSIVTPNGLVATNFTCDRHEPNQSWNNQSVQASFKISQAGVSNAEPTECRSGFN